MAHITVFGFKSDAILEQMEAAIYQVTQGDKAKGRVNLVCTESVFPDGAYGSTLDLIVCDASRLVDMDRLARRKMGLGIHADDFFSKPIIVIEGFMPDDETLWFTKKQSFVGSIPAIMSFVPQTWQHLLTVVDASKKKKCTPRSLTAAIREADSGIVTLGKPNGLRCEG